MTLLVAGIDGGQSSTVALIADEHGRILSRGTAGPADEVGSDASSTRLRDALSDALGDACRRAGLPPQRDFAAIVAGVSGYGGRVHGAKPAMPTQRFVLLHDAPVAHAGALAGLAGVVVIAGTGSVVYSRDESGASRTLGGWGFLFGDEGSAFGIARDGLSLVMRAQDDGDRSLDDAARVAREFFELDSLAEIARAFYSGAVTRKRVAELVPAALHLPVFRAVADRGADRLAALACRLLAPMTAPRAALVGGLFSDAGFYDRVTSGIAAGVAGAKVVPAAYEPCGGALLLAYRELGLPMPELHS